MEGKVNLHLKTLFFAAFLASTLRAQPLPLIPMQTDNPDQLARSLRDKQPLMPMRDCKALDLQECHPDDPTRVTDISVRWVQLDDDPELEAIILTEAKSENTYAAFVFDKQSRWNLVGSFFASRWSLDGQELIRVQKLTEDSPMLLLVNRDLGGSGSSILTTEAFQLREGKLWPVITITNKEEDLFPSLGVEHQQVLASSHRLVIHTVREKPPGRVVENECEVRRWEVAKHAFVPAANEQVKYCNSKTGEPVTGKSFRIALPLYP